MDEYSESYIFDGPEIDVFIDEKDHSKTYKGPDDIEMKPGIYRIPLKYNVSIFFLI